MDGAPPPAPKAHFPWLLASLLNPSQPFGLWICSEQLPPPILHRLRACLPPNSGSWEGRGMPCSLASHRVVQAPLVSAATLAEGHTGHSTQDVAFLALGSPQNKAALQGSLLGCSECSRWQGRGWHRGCSCCRMGTSELRRDSCEEGRVLSSSLTLGHQVFL